MKKTLAFVLDFDGTITTVDVSHILLTNYARSQWRDLLERAKKGENIGKAWLLETAPLLPADRYKLLDFVMKQLNPRPGFEEFVAWAQGQDCGLFVATDGYGFYVEPFLAAQGVSGIKVYRNQTIFGPPQRLILGHPHPDCDLCGTCKVKCVLEAKGEFDHVIFVGNGQNDRFGASHAHAIFARDELVSCCKASGLPHYRWDTFFDIMDLTKRGIEFHDPAGLSLCPVSPVSFTSKRLQENTGLPGRQGPRYPG